LDNIELNVDGGQVFGSANDYEQRFDSGQVDCDDRVFEMIDRMLRGNLWNMILTIVLILLVSILIYT